MRVDLSGRVSLVTGASRNIGRAVALTLASSGAFVVVGYGADEAAARKVCDDIRTGGGRGVPYWVELTDVEQLRSAVSAISALYGTIDILVHCAAVRPRVRIEAVTPEEWDFVQKVNLRGPFFLTQAVLPGMRAKRWGRIIFVGGVDAYWGKPQRPHVVASKLGVVGLSRALANETARWGITVNTVVPGTIDTKRARPEWYGEVDRFYSERLERIPLARLGSPHDVAWACLFLASNEAAYITGQELFVSGGAFPLVRQPCDEYDD